MLLNEINRTLKPIISEIQRARILDAQIKDLEKQQIRDKQRVERLKEIEEKEREDVDKLYKRNLTMLGRRLKREKGEHEEAKQQYKEALMAVSDLQTEIQELQHQRELIGDSGDLHRELIKIKEKVLLTQNHPATEHLMALEEKILCLQEEIKEVEEGMAAVNLVLKKVEALFLHIKRIEDRGMVWYRESSATRIRIQFQPWALEVHKANHKVLSKLLDLKRTYRIANGDRMQNFYTLFMVKLSGLISEHAYFLDFTKKLYSLCRSQVFIVKQIRQDLWSHKKHIQTQINMVRERQKRIIEHA